MKVGIHLFSRRHLRLCRGHRIFSSTSLLPIFARFYTRDAGSAGSRQRMSILSALFVPDQGRSFFARLPAPRTAPEQVLRSPVRSIGATCLVLTSHVLASSIAP